jgi:hypothetical protein
LGAFQRGATRQLSKPHRAGARRHKASKGQASNGEAIDEPLAFRSFLASVLQLPNFSFDAREAIKLDFASYVLE